MEEHPVWKFVISRLRATDEEFEALRDYMPNPAMLDSEIHGWKHTAHMLAYASELCYHVAYNMDVVYRAILFHDSGRKHDQADPEHPHMGALVANAFMETERDGHSNLDAIIAIILRHNMTDSSRSTEEAVVRTCDRLDLLRMDGFDNLKPELMHAPGWKRVEKLARRFRLEGDYAERSGDLEEW